MGSHLVLLRLEGPLQSWGLRSRWDVRDSGDEPSKSAIVGLLGCALGYPMGDPRLAELDQQIAIGVRVESPGRKITDFQTISGIMPTADGGVKGRLDDPSTIVSPRAYLQDAAFLVVIAGAEPLLSQCAGALASPHWPIYLGRKSCPPTRPVLVGVTSRYAGLEDALQHHPWDWQGYVLGVRMTIPDRLRYVLEDQAGSGIRPDRTLSNPGRMFGHRAVTVDWTPFPGVVPDEGEAACISHS